MGVVQAVAEEEEAVPPGQEAQDSIVPSL